MPDPWPPPWMSLGDLISDFKWWGLKEMIEDDEDAPDDDWLYEETGTMVWCPTFRHEMPLSLKNAGEPCRECEADA